MKKYCRMMVIAVLLMISTVAQADQNKIGRYMESFFRLMAGRSVVDGPGMEYDRIKYNLQTQWVEITEHEKPLRINISDSTCTFSDLNGEIGAVQYVLPQGADFNQTIYLQTWGSMMFDSLVFHYEEVGGRLIPLLSATAIELDGRGEIVLAEFVAEENLDCLPAGFCSSFSLARNNAYVPPAYMPPMKDAPQEGDLMKGKSFYARIVCNRYGHNSDVDDYASGQFLLWVEQMTRTQAGEFIPVGDEAAIPYIVNPSGNEANLGLLSGGWDGLYPYGEAVLLLTTDEMGSIVDVVFCE